MSSKPRFVGEKVRLGDVCTIVSGATPKTKTDEYWGGEIKWITPAELNSDSHYVSDTEKHLTVAGYKSASLHMMPKGTVLLTTRAPIGKVAIATEEMCCNQGFKNLVCSSAINNEYLFLYLKSRTAELQAMGRGATFKELSKKNVSGFEINLPAIDCQLDAVAKLTAIENQIARAKQQIDQLNSLVKSRFVEMFGVYEPDCTIDEACVVLSGFAFKSTRYVDDGIRIIRIANVQKGYIEDKTPCYYPETDQNAAANYALREDDLLVSLTGNVGRVGLMTKEMLPAALNQRVACLRPKSSNKLNTRYLFALLNLDEFEKAAIEASSGSAQKNLSIKWLKSHCIAIPPSEIQSAFSAFCNQVDKSRFS